MSEPEIDTPLSQDEETVLLILVGGDYLAPIGRWEKPLKSLAARGFAAASDEFNYGVTPAGRALAERKDNQFFRGWIKGSNAAVAVRQERQHLIGEEIKLALPTQPQDPTTWSRPNPVGPHVVSGKLIFCMPDGSALSCECIGEPYASEIVAMWKAR